MVVFRIIMAETKTIIVKTIGQLAIYLPSDEEGVVLSDLADLYKKIEGVLIMKLSELNGVPVPELDELNLKEELLAWQVRGVNAHIRSIFHVGECLVENRLDRPHTHGHGSHELVIAGPPEKIEELEELLTLKIPRRFPSLSPKHEGKGSWVEQQNLEVPREFSLRGVSSVGHLSQIIRESNEAIGREREF